MTAIRLLLSGCQPEPLGSYLKSLGVLRLVANQVDTAATGHWTSEGFVLTSTLDFHGLVEFFATSYIPTPVVGPWNKGSGFHPGDNTDGIGPIESSTDPRFALYRSAIAIGKRVLSEIPLAKEQKFQIIQACRSQLPDEALPWLDAAVVLLDGEVAYPPILGTGGNDLRLDFSNNFMQRLVLLFGLGGKIPRGASAVSWFRAALDGSEVPGIHAAIGQFAPGSNGGPNSGPVTAADSIVNPGDFVLLVEGATAVASGSAKRLSSVTLSVGGGGDTPKQVAMPFTFAASAAGYASAVKGEDGHGELWLPLWSRPARFGEIARLFSEARCTWSGRTARTGLDAARAAVTLGVDRGVDAFTRWALVTRNGRSTVALPVSRVAVIERAEVNVLASLDPWLDRVHRTKNPPNALAPQLVALERAMFVAAAGGGAALFEALVAAASVDAVVSTASAFRSTIRPLWVEALRWEDVIVAAAEDPVVGAAVRLAAGLASLRDRLPGSMQTLAEGLRPVRREGRGLAWTERALVGGLGRRPIQEVLADLHDRRWILARQRGRSAPGGPFDFGGWVSIGDCAALASGSVDQRQLESYLAALLLLDWGRNAPRVPLGPKTSSNPALALLAPGFGAVYGVDDEDRPQAQPNWAGLLSTGSPNALRDVLEDARRRIVISGWRPLVSAVGVASGAGDPRWLSSALLLRMSAVHRRHLLEQVSAQTSKAPSGAPDQENKTDGIAHHV